MQEKRDLDEILEESNNMLKRAMTLTFQSEEMATQTLNDLTAQAEKLEMMNETLNLMDANQEKAKQYISSLSGFWRNLLYFLRNFSMRNFRIIGRVRQLFAYQYKPFLIQDFPSEQVSVGISDDRKTVPILELSESSTKEQREQHHDNEELLEKLCGSLDRLSLMAKQMSNELDNQNKYLADINNHADVTNQNMKTSINAARNI